MYDDGFCCRLIGDRLPQCLNKLITNCDKSQSKRHYPENFGSREAQITAILSGKRVAGPQREIDEVKGAHAAYEAIESFNPYSIDDLLKAHGLMTKGLVDRPGKFRNCNVGVMDGAGNVVHMAPPFSNVPSLVKDLFAWLADSEDPVLIKSCVFHYEFEFIHPFPDGNGRTGRLWQTALLGSWRNEFYGAPVENIVWAHQQEYYQAIRASTAAGECGPLIDFMLDKILRTLMAKGKAYGAANEKSSQKSSQKILYPPHRPGQRRPLGDCLRASFLV